MNAAMRLAVWIAVATLAAPGSADAHIVAARLGDFYAGALHPLTDLQDVVLWVALGVFAGSTGPDRGRWLVIVVPLSLLAGFAWQLASGGLSLGTLGNSVLMLCLGLALATRIRTNTALLCAVAATVGAVRGAANAGGVVPETNVVLFAAGLATAGYATITLIVALTVALHRNVGAPSGWREIALRVCGSWIAAVGLMIGGLALKSGSV